mmetsp:Transcript_94589/g.276443  ORF Transcript_94589/g.276443 Transcript_94589/m.276443 type:complete len:267 (-) Transcript_94589:93-893(-)
MHLAVSFRSLWPAALLALEVHAELKIIGAGLPRTGTESLTAALRTLGYQGVQHDLCNPPTDCQKKVCEWMAGGAAEPAVSLVREQNWEVVTDEPLCLMYGHLAEAFPAAKVILTVRDTADQWYESFAQMQEYIFSMKNQSGGEFKPYIQSITKDRSLPPWDMCDQAPHEKFGCPIFSSTQTEEAHRGCLDGYEAFNAEVKRAIPPERLLVFNVKEGWGPLCEFLGLPVPEAPFPRVNTYMDLLKLFRASQQPSSRNLRRHEQKAVQ